VSRHPLVAHRRLTDVVSYRRGAPVTVGRFLADVERIAAEFPAGQHVLNACTDRYRFAVGFAAALVAGKVTLLPANLAPETVRQLTEFRPDLFCLTDGDHPLLELPRMTYRDAAAIGEPAPEIAVPEIDADRPVAWLFTSGSTGEPVPHLKTWGPLVRSVGIEADRLGLQSGRGDVIVATVPPQHSYGLESSVLVALQGGVAFSAARPFYPADICAALAEVPRPRVLVSTPFHLRLLLDSGTTIPEIDLVVSATAPLSSALIREVEGRFGAPLLEIFGSTDTGQIASRRPSVSTEWHLFTGVRLSPEEDRTWAFGGHVGPRIVLNDVVELMGDERFRLLGRSSDLVNVAGKRSSMAFLTHQLTTIPGVLDGAYFMRDEEAQDGVTRLAAVVVAPKLTAAELGQALRARIDPAFLPRPLVFVDALPRNDTGKMPREALRHLIETRGNTTAEQKVNPVAGIPLAIAVDHPAFAGHFPGSPIVPGVVLLDEAMFVIAAASGLAHHRIAWAKFLRPVRPGQALIVRYDIEASGAIRFEIIAGADKVVTGSLSPAAAP
jgi:acyl-coenzyme A synthetase/AMP-(fatty) acid ligase